MFTLCNLASFHEDTGVLRGALAARGAETEVLRGEFESLLTLLRPEGGVDKGDLAKIKEQVFGPTVFWVTDTRLTDDLTEGGWLVRWR